MGKAVLVVHLGLSGRIIGDEDRESLSKLIRYALEDGYKAGLTGTAVDMVVEAVRVLEDSGLVNAGVGSVVDISGSISMDAGVMYSGYPKAGSVAYVKYPKNPIRLARFVMERTDHVILVGEPADILAAKIGLERHPGPSMAMLEKFRDAMEKIKQGIYVSRVYEKSIELWRSLGFMDTVGAVARDRFNEFGAAVSTGGIFLKMPGRVGDSAIPGAGFYANRCGAAVATGIGEYILMTLLTFNVVRDLCSGFSVDEAVDRTIKLVTERYGTGTAGIIAIDSAGRAYGNHNAKSMPWGYIDEDRRIHIFV